MVNSKYISNKYKTLVNSKKVINDEGQREAIEALDVLYSMVKSTFSINSNIIQENSTFNNSQFYVTLTFIASLSVCENKTGKH